MSFKRPSRFGCLAHLAKAGLLPTPNLATNCHQRHHDRELATIATLATNFQLPYFIKLVSLPGKPTATNTERGKAGKPTSNFLTPRSYSRIRGGCVVFPNGLPIGTGRVAGTSSVGAPSRAYSGGIPRGPSSNGLPALPGSTT